MKIFISYARGDSAQVKELARFLSDSGHDAWMDSRLLPGQDWKQNLSSQIVAADLFTSIISNRSVASEWCRWELGQAFLLGKPVLPILLDSVTIPDEIKHLHAVPYNLRDRIMGGIAAASAQGAGHEIERKFDFPSSPRGRPSRVLGEDPSALRHLHKRNINAGRTWDLGPDDIYKFSGRIVGIDFGTTSSLCAVVENEVPKIIPNRFGSLSTPSAVYIKDRDTLVVGGSAVSSILRDPKNGVLNVKRMLGTGAELHSYGRIWSGAELAAEVIRTLLFDASTFLGTKVQGAIVSVPAYFTELQLEDLTAACHLAGLLAVRFIPEPGAACLAAEFLQKDERGAKIITAVVDLGGGTFDVCILDLGEGLFEVKAIGGENELGGIDYDEVLVEYCINAFLDQTGVNLSMHFGARMRIRDAAEKAKIELTFSNTAQIFVPYIYADASGAMDLIVTISREQFVELTRPLTSKVLKCCENTIAAWRESSIVDRLAHIDHLLFVGLPTRTPAIQELLTSLFGCKPVRKVNPETCVAEGAAYQGGIIEGRIKGSLFLDVVAHDLSIETIGGIATRIVTENTHVPTRKSQIFIPEREGQTHVKVNVLQGSREKAKENLLLSSIVVEIGDEPHPQIEITFDLNAGKTLTISIGQIGKPAQRTITFGGPVFERFPKGVQGGLLRLPNPSNSDVESSGNDQQGIAK